MASSKEVLRTDLVNMADAMRSKTGSQDLMTLDQMSEVDLSVGGGSSSAVTNYDGSFGLFVHRNNLTYSGYGMRAEFQITFSKPLTSVENSIAFIFVEAYYIYSSGENRTIYPAGSIYKNGSMLFSIGNTGWTSIDNYWNITKPLVVSSFSTTGMKVWYYFRPENRINYDDSDIHLFVCSE